MHRTPRRALGLVLLMPLVLASCAKPGQDVAAPAGIGDAPVAAATAAPTVTALPAVKATPVAPATPAGPVVDRFDPVVTATDAGWLVGWTEATRPARVAVAFVPFGAAPPARLAPSAVLAEGPVAGLRLAGPQAVWVSFVGGERTIATRRLDARGALEPAGAAVILATGATLGSPEIAATPEGPVVAWTDGLRVHAVRLDGAGAVVARAWWWGGNARPERMAQPEGAEPEAVERSAATPARPWIRLGAAGAPLEVLWQADWWFSDDQGGTVTAHHAVTWGGEGGAATEMAPLGSVWSWLADVDPSGAGLRLVQEHDPNGGPWLLRLDGLGAAAIEVARGPAGPYAVDVVGAPVAIVAFHDAVASAYRVARYDAAGGRQEGVMPTLAPFGEAAVAVAGAAPGGAGGGAAGVAYTTVTDGHVDVVFAALGAGEGGERPGPRLARPQATVVTLGASFDPSQADAVRVGEHTLLTWQDHWDWQIRAVWLKDGAAVGPVATLSAGSPRSEAGATAALRDGGALVVFHRCEEQSICGQAQVVARKLAPGAKAVPVDLGARLGDRHPRVCVGAAGTVLAVQRGSYGSVTVTWEADGARHTVDVPTPNRNNGGFAQGLSCGAGGIFVAMTSVGDANDTTRVDVVAIAAAGATTRETLQVPGSLWSANALVDDGDRVGLVTNLASATGGDVGLRWYATAAAAEPTVDVLWRGRTMFHPHVAQVGAGPARRFAVAWYDRASDGVYATLAAPDGRRVAGPVRLDDPAKRESSNAPVLVHEGDGWWGYWQEERQLWRARAF